MSGCHAPQINFFILEIGVGRRQSHKEGQEFYEGINSCTAKIAPVKIKCVLFIIVAWYLNIWIDLQVVGFDKDPTKYYGKANAIIN